MVLEDEDGETLVLSSLFETTKRKGLNIILGISSPMAKDYWIYIQSKYSFKTQTLRKVVHKHSVFSLLLRGK